MAWPAQGAPTDLFNQANNRMTDKMGEMKSRIAETNHDTLKQALAWMEAGNNLTVDGASAIVRAR